MKLPSTPIAPTSVSETNTPTKSGGGPGVLNCSETQGRVQGAVTRHRRECVPYGRPKLTVTIAVTPEEHASVNTAKVSRREAVIVDDTQGNMIRISSLCRTQL